MSPTNIDPPDSIPDDITTALEGCSDTQLREIVHYAQQLLSVHPPLTEEIESRPGEDVVRIEEGDSSTIVIVERPEETGEARGPFAYRVDWQPGIDDADGKYRWHYLGKVYGDADGD